MIIPDEPISRDNKFMSSDRLRSVKDYLKGLQAVPKYKNGEKYWEIFIELSEQEIADRISKGLR